MISEAKAQIESEKQSAIADIRQQVATLSVSIAEKVLRKNLASDTEQMGYVDNLLNELSSKDNK
jgi:F-type H+-transporting ATPase subunit b